MCSFEGAYSVGYQVLNAESRKYFQRIISMSGTAFNPSAFHHGNHKCLIHAIAKNASQPVNSTEQLIEFVRRVPARQIQNFIDENVKLPFPLFWAPFIESKFDLDFYAINVACD